MRTTRCISVLLCVLMLLTWLPASAMAAESEAAAASTKELVLVPSGQSGTVRLFTGDTFRSDESVSVSVSGGLSAEYKPANPWASDFSDMPARVEISYPSMEQGQTAAAVFYGSGDTPALAVYLRAEGAMRYVGGGLDKGADGTPAAVNLYWEDRKSVV